MIDKIIFHEMAETGLNEAAEYYETRVDGLGKAFLSEVERVTKIIALNPNISPIILGNVRKKILWRFPYSIMYSVNDKIIRVLAITNHKRRPFYWRSRR